MTTAPAAGRDGVPCATTFSPQRPYQAPEASIRADVARGARDRQHPFGRHPALGLGYSLDGQIGHRVVVVFPLGLNAGRIPGLFGAEFPHDPPDGLMGRAALDRRKLDTTQALGRQQ